MADPFVAEIRIVGFSFAPSGWAICDGQLIAIRQNTMLFSLLGTTYGGDGKSTFALPDLQGRAAMHPEQGPGLSDRYLGETGGSETVTLFVPEMPQHNHSLMAEFTEGYESSPNQNILAATYDNSYSAPPAYSMLSPYAVRPAGGGQAHNNMQPYLALNFCIALQGDFPPRP